jgi:hypothetical protein
MKGIFRAILLLLCVIFFICMTYLVSNVVVSYDKVSNVVSYDRKFYFLSFNVIIVPGKRTLALTPF